MTKTTSKPVTKSTTLIRNLSRVTALVAMAGLSTPALGQVQSATAKLRAEVTVSSDLVRLGDLVDGAGAVAGTPVFRAPDVGTTGTVQVSRVLAAARDKGLASIDTLGLASISVTRASRVVSTDELERALRLAVVRANGLDADVELTVSLDRGVRAVRIEPEVTAPIVVGQLTWNAASGRFDAVIEADGSAILDRAPVRISGTAVETVDVPVFTRALNRGDVIRAADIAVDRQPRGMAARDGVAGLAPAIGQAVRRNVRAGQPILSSDLTKPNLVNRNDAVSLVCETPGMVLTVRAKALDAGAQGDTIAVLNAQSNRVVQATVTGAGRVSVLVGTSVALN